MSASSPLPKDAPIMQAWEAYQKTAEYQNTFRWAVHPEHREGSLWGAFLAGWQRASGATEDQPVARVQPVESTQQNEPNDDERVEYERLVKALRNAREAIARLDEDALGRDQREGWPYRDELLAEIDAALGGQQKGVDK